MILKNILAQSFRKARDFLGQDHSINLVLKLYKSQYKDVRVYNLPTSNEVAGSIVDDLDTMEVGRDIIVRKQGSDLIRLYETYTTFIPLQYPLIFPYGEDGYQEDISISDFRKNSQTRTRQHISMREFIAFRIQEITYEFGNILSGGRLFQQFIVDCYTMIESQRSSEIRTNQKTIRCDVLNGLHEVVTKGETNPSIV